MVNSFINEHSDGRWTLTFGMPELPAYTGIVIEITAEQAAEIFKAGKKYKRTTKE